MVGYECMPVPNYGFIKWLNLVARFGQRKVLCGNTAVIDVPFLCLLQASIFLFIYFCVSSTNKNSVG